MSHASEVASLSQYSDIQAVLDAALALDRGPGEVCGTINLPSGGQAVNWQHRANTFRKRFRNVYGPNSPYDRLTFPKLEKGATEVVIKMRGYVGATFTPVGGAPAPKEEDDELLAVARDVAKKLRGEL